MTKRPNVLFVVIDQFRADLLHGALADHVDLPNLRALGADAVSFHGHYSVANPCGPARASLLTGQYAMNHRSVRNGTPLPHDKPNLARELRKAGYLPLLFGYTDTPQDPRVHDPADPALHTYEEVLPGFEQAVEMRLEESWPWRADLLAKGYDVPPLFEIYRPDGPKIDDPAIYSAQDSDTAFLTDRTIEALAARPPGWCAHVTYIRPHPPLVAPAPYNRMIDPAGVAPPNRPRSRAQEHAMHPFNGPLIDTFTAASNVIGFRDLDESDETIATLRALYLGLAAEVDHHLGRLIAFLKQSGQYDDTLIVVTADHGEMLGDHHAWGKMSYHDPAWHVPLIIRDPARPDAHGRVVAAPSESVDVVPTILAALGRAVPDTMDGASLVPFLDGQTPQTWRKFTFSELDFGNPVMATPWQTALGLTADAANLAILRGPGHTLVHFNSGLAPLLFDHSFKSEAENIAGTPDANGALLNMSRAMLDHRMTHAEGLFARTQVTQGGVLHGRAD